MATRTSAIGTFNNGDNWSEAHIDSLPAGWLGWIERTSDQGSITTETDVSGVTLTVTLNASRRIRISAIGQHTATNADTVAQLTIKEGSTSIAYDRSPTAFANVSYNNAMEPWRIITPSAGSHTYKLTIQRLVGTGTVTLVADTDRPVALLVEDVGAV